MNISVIARFMCAEVRRFRSDTSGSAMVFVGVTLTAILGFAGLGIDVANLYSERRATQSMADAAAISGTYADISTAGDLTAVQQAAISEATRNGYIASAGNAIQVAVVPNSGLPQPIRPRVDVLVQREINLVFLRMFVAGPTQTVAARAIGGWRNLGPMCVISLDETEAGAITFSGSTTANVSCGVSSNSSSGSAIDISGSATLVANPAQAYGDISISGSGQLVSNYPPLPHSPRVPDPYENEVFPSAPATCDLTNLTVPPNTTVNINAGGGSFKICGDVDVRGTLNLGAGTYYVSDGDVDFNAQSHVSGTDVTLVMTGSASSNVGDIHINGGADIDLQAPSSGPYESIVIFIDPIADRQLNRLNGGATMSLLGVVYAPSQDTEYSGGTGTGGCTQLIARTITFTGNSFIENTPALCQNVGLNLSDDEGSQRQVVLVE
jgi:hypothetical protein